MTKDRAVEVLVEEGDVSRGELLVRSPAVGMYSHAPRVGEVLTPQSYAGRLSCLRQTMHLVLPSGLSGRVAERALYNRRDPVEYGQLLLRLLPVETSQVEVSVREAQSAVEGLPVGCYAITSPTHGMFYRRPRPDAPPYVEIGQVVDEGATLALVEVMKCFSAIAYGGGRLPPQAEVVEVRAEDASEVQADQILFVVRPART